MRSFRAVVCGLAALSLSGIAAANNDDGFVWIDANTRIKVKPIATVKPVSTEAPAPEAAGNGASAHHKAAPKKREKKERPAK